MSKPKLAKANVNKARKGWPFVAYVGIIGLGLIGYLFGEMALGMESHPLHWLAALIGAVLGGLLGWAWYEWRGDIV